MNRRKFVKLPPEKASEMFSLVLERMQWMDEKGIEHWNVVEYDRIYPLSYYEEKCRDGLAFALEDENGAPVCAAVLLYVHNLASKLGERDAGAEFLRRAGEYAVGEGKAYLRLDSAEDSAALAKYYESLGFVNVGTCQDGSYKGILREKKLK